MSTLDLLTGDARAFCEKAWASRVHRHHVAADRVDDLVGSLTLDDVDRLLTETAIRTPAVRLAQDGAVLPEQRYTRSATLAGRPLTGLVDPRKVIDLVDGGATLVLQGLHRYHPPLTRMVAELEVELGHPCQVNAYLTPPGAQGFAVHSDTHDVFVYQTHGTKQWEVHEGPVGDQVAHDVLLEPGLAMYLPTGTPHAARAQSTASLHVTIGVNQHTWRGLVRRAVTPLLDAVDDGHLPAGHLDDAGTARAVRDGLAERLHALAEAVRDLDTDTAADAEVRRFLTTRSPRLEGALSDRLAGDGVAGVGDDTPLRRRPGHPCVLLDAAHDRVELLLGDRSLFLPAWTRPALDDLRERSRDGVALRPADLGDHLDRDSRLVLCRRLVREGLLTPR